jgi:Domain of unknown function (DUF4145)
MARTIENLGIIDRYPRICPFCHASIVPLILAHNFNDSGSTEIVFTCPAEFCGQAFIAYYRYSHDENGIDHYQFSDFTTRGNPLQCYFSNEIRRISPEFCKIYREAYTAEQSKLLRVAGIGYRKALEFLVKEYLISKETADNKIEKMTLNECIQKIDDPEIKEAADIARLLGNDESHFFRKHDYSVQDLRRVIGIVQSYIEKKHELLKMRESMEQSTS